MYTELTDRQTDLNDKGKAESDLEKLFREACVMIAHVYQIVHVKKVANLIQII